VNESITLNGSATDSDGTIVSYEWKRGEDVLGTEANLTYTPTTVGTERLTFTVTDDDGATGSDEVKLLVEEESNAISDTEAVELAKEELSLGDTQSITTNLTLPATGIHGTTITYSSSNESLLSDKGVVNRPEFGTGDVEVIVTATINKNDVSDTKSFTVIVKEEELSLPGV